MIKVHWGHDVTLLCSRAQFHAPSDEEKEIGNQYTVTLWSTPIPKSGKLKTLTMVSKEELKVLYRLPPKLTDPDRYKLKITHDKVQNAAQSHRLPDRYEEENNE